MWRCIKLPSNIYWIDFYWHHNSFTSSASFLGLSSVCIFTSVVLCVLITQLYCQEAYSVQRPPYGVREFSDKLCKVMQLLYALTLTIRAGSEYIYSNSVLKYNLECEKVSFLCMWQILNLLVYCFYSTTVVPSLQIENLDAQNIQYSMM